MTTLSLPARNPDGTPAAKLSESALTALARVRDLILLVEAAAPQERDYRLAGPTILSLAVTDRHALTLALEEVANELVALDARESHPPTLLHATGTHYPTSPSVYPLIHPDGTKVSELLDAAQVAFRGANFAEEAMHALEPILRDYANADALNRAQAQHARRVKILHDVGGFFLKLTTEIKAASAQTAAG